jgi:hypothetical protein
VPAALRRAATGRADVAADLERIAGAWSLAERHGVPLADLLAKVHDDVRWRIRFAATVRAQLAGPAATVRCADDNSMVRKMLETDGKGRLSSRSGILRRSILCSSSVVIFANSSPRLVRARIWAGSN